MTRYISLQDWTWNTFSYLTSDGDIVRKDALAAEVESAGGIDAWLESPVWLESPGEPNPLLAPKDAKDFC
jgi:hypothetical protein